MKIYKNVLLFLFVFISSASFAQVGIGTTTPDNSATLDVKSTTKGFLPPRMKEAERDAITTPAAGLIVWCTNCGSDGEIQVFNGTSWTNLIGGTAATPPPPQVGDYRDGGVVFYVAPSPTDLNGDGNDDTGLVCAVEDQSSGIKWDSNGTDTTFPTGAYGVGIGTGSSNTSIVINQQISAQTNYGVALAANYNGGGFNDWFLPSKDELNKMYDNKSTINTTAISNAGEAFANKSYWSSTEDNQDQSFIQSLDFGGQIPSAKNNLFRVRAVRAF